MGQHPTDLQCCKSNNPRNGFALKTKCRIFQQQINKQQRMARHYQDHDPLHGNGKAMPHPNQPANYTFRRKTFRFSFARLQFLTERLIKNSKGAKDTVLGTVKSIIKKAFAKKTPSR